MGKREAASANNTKARPVENRRSSLQKTRKLLGAVLRLLFCLRQGGFGVWFCFVFVAGLSFFQTHSTTFFNYQLKLSETDHETDRHMARPMQKRCDLLDCSPRDAVGDGTLRLHPAVNQYQPNEVDHHITSPYWLHRTHHPERFCGCVGWSK